MDLYNAGNSLPKLASERGMSCNSLNSLLKRRGVWVPRLKVRPEKIVRVRVGKVAPVRGGITGRINRPFDPAELAEMAYWHRVVRIRITEIAHTFGRTPQSLSHALRTRKLWVPRLTPQHFTDKQRAEVKRLRKSGMSWERIGKRLRMDFSTLHRAFKDGKRVKARQNKTRRCTSRRAG